MKVRSLKRACSLALLGLSAYSGQSAQTYYPDLVRKEFFHGVGGGGVADLQNAPRFIANQPDAVSFGAWEIPTNAADNYGDRLSALISVGTSGNYRFMLSSDDNSALYLSTDETPGNAVQIATEPNWVGSREYNGDPHGNRGTAAADGYFQNVSKPIALETGKRYYAYSLHKEGGGGDDLAVTAFLDDGVNTPPANGTDPLGGPANASGVSVGVNIDDCVSILVQPKDAVGALGSFASFSVAASDHPLGVTYQWKRSGAPIVGATGNSYSIVSLTAEEMAASFSVVVTSGAGCSVESAAAHITPGHYEDGLALREIWDNVGGGGVGDLTSSGNYIWGKPDRTTLTPLFQIPQDSADNYGSRVSAYITVPADGDYRFVVSSDDNSSVYISSDTDPANLVQIAREPNWSGARQWNGDPNANRGTANADGFFPNVSDPITLSAGQEYLLVVLQKEGGGGDNMALTAWAVGDSEPADGTDPLGGAGNTSGITMRTVVPDTAAPVLIPGFAKMAVWHRDGGNGSSAIDAFLANPLVPNYPDRTFNIPTLDSRGGYPDDSHDQYGARLTTLLTVPVEGDYRFFIHSDDAGRLNLSTDADPANAVKVAEETGCCNGFSEPGTARTSAPIHLIPGQQYFMEFLYEEGGGGDVGQVAIRMEGDTTLANLLPPIDSAYLSSYIIPAGHVSISEQPKIIAPTDPAQIAVNGVVTLEANGTGDINPVVLQWLRNGVPIPGAHSTTYQTVRLTADDLTTPPHYSLQVSIPGAVTVSSDIVLHLNADVTPPTVTDAIGSDSFDTITVTFSEPVDQATAEDASHYSIPGLTINSATLSADKLHVVLSTSAQTIGAPYTVTVTGVKDTSGLTIAGGNTAGFHGFALTQGLLRFEVWYGINGTAVSALTGDPRFPASPDFRAYTTAFNTRPVFPDDGHDNYGGRMSGWIKPAVSGSYTFFVASDDASALYISPDADPAGVLNPDGTLIAPIAVETGCCHAFTEPPSPLASAPIDLVADQMYYIQMLWKEGGGGDFAQLAWRLDGDTTRAGALQPIPGQYLYTYADAAKGAPVITKQPASVTVDRGGSATFSVEAAIGTQPVTYQWAHDGVDIAGATSATLSVNNLDVSNITGGVGSAVNAGRNVYTCRVSNDIGSVTSGPGMVFFTGTKFIEAEDFNFGAGEYVTDKEIGMNGPYDGDAFNGLGTDATDKNVDYNANGINGTAYRTTTGVSAGKENSHPDGLPRGSWSVKANWVVGWNDVGEWYNYTRQFPDAPTEYSVVARAASGGGNIGGELAVITGDPTSTSDNQVVTKIGNFKPGRQTAGWDTMEFFDMTDDGGIPVTVTLSGVTTLRMTLASGAMDFDYIMFIPKGAAVQPPHIDSIVRNADGTVTVTWSGGGILESTTSLTAPDWQPAAANSPFTFTPPAGLKEIYGRIRK